MFVDEVGEIKQSIVGTFIVSKSPIGSMGHFVKKKKRLVKHR